MSHLVINVSKPHYNLGARKIVNWLQARGEAVRYSDGDPGLFAGDAAEVWLSCIFSWHAPLARDLALRFRERMVVHCGGPGMSMLAGWWRRETGMEATIGLDPRFERQRGNYVLTFASRGCPVGCWFCIVPRLEGREFTLDWDFQPAAVLGDNNLSALPEAFQSHIIRRYQETGVPLKDANSGFEPKPFTAATYRRWKPILRGPWRFAYDETAEQEDVRRMMAVLEAESPRRKQVYVLVGNEPPAECYCRAEQVIAWGGEPFCQFVLPLNWLGDRRTLKMRHGWTDALGRDFCRYYNRHLWRSLPLREYRPRQGESPPFAVIEDSSRG